MAQDDNRYRSLRAPGLGAAAASEVVRRALDEHPELTVHDIGPGRISVARTLRPRWATVACACTFWLGGLGLLFLLVRRTEAGEVVASDGPRGCVVTLPPLLAGELADKIAADLLSAEPDNRFHAVARPAPAGEPSEVDHLEDRTVARRDRPEAPTGSRRPAGTAVAVLRFDEGEITVAPGVPVVIGRDPSASGEARACVVPGDASTVSKSHLLVAFDGTGSTVEDLGSTNGTTVVRGRAAERLEPGAAVPIRDGDRVVVGTLGFAVQLRGVGR